MAEGGSARGARSEEGRAIEVFLLGDLNVDLGLDMNAFPAPGGDGVAHRQRFGFGGSAANTAVVLQKLGIQTAMLSCIGDDHWGNFALGELAELGIEGRFVERSAAHSTSLNVVAVTPDGERTMLAYRGASAEYRSELLPRAALESARHLHISGYALLADPQRSAATEAAVIARAAGLTISLDVPVDPVNAVPGILRDFLALIDIVIVGAPEARQLTGAITDEDAAQALAGLGASCVAVKQGADGTLIVRDGELARVRVPRVPVLDTTGAGDSYCSGLIWAFLDGVTELTDIGAMANSCGASAVAVPGAGRNLPGRAEVLAMLRDSADSSAQAMAARLTASAVQPHD